MKKKIQVALVVCVAICLAILITRYVNEEPSSEGIVDITTGSKQRGKQYPIIDPQNVELRITRELSPSIIFRKGSIHIETLTTNMGLVLYLDGNMGNPITNRYGENTHIGPSRTVNIRSMDPGPSEGIVLLHTIKK